MVISENSFFGTEKLIKYRYLTIKMKLQKQLSRKYEGKEYAKYVIVVKPSIIEELGWKDGIELGAEIKGDKLVIVKN